MCENEWFTESEDGLTWDVREFGFGGMIVCEDVGEEGSELGGRRDCGRRVIGLVGGGCVEVAMCRDAE